MDSDTTENSPPILCSKPGCKRLAGARYKRCDLCRNCQAETVQKGRSKRKAAEAAGKTDLPKERKRTRKEDSLRDLSEDETIPQNPQVVCSDDDEEEDDGIPFLDLDKKVSCIIKLLIYLSRYIPLRWQ